MEYPSYLVHFNRNHSPKNGQFTNGDGDGDGSKDERGRHGRYKPEAIGNHGDRSSVSSDDPRQKIQKFAIKTGLKLAVKGGKWAAGKAFAMTKLGKQFNQIKGEWVSVGQYALANTDLKKAMESSNWSNYSAGLKMKKDRFVDNMYDKAADSINRKVNKYMEE